MHGLVSVAPASVPPRFEINVVVSGWVDKPDSRASRSSVPGEKNGSHRPPHRDRACKPLAGDDAHDACLGRLAEDEERDGVSDPDVQAVCELVVDDDLAVPRRQARTGPKPNPRSCGLGEVQVPQQGDRFGSRHAVSCERRRADRVVHGEHSVDVRIRLQRLEALGDRGSTCRVSGGDAFVDGPERLHRDVADRCVERVADREAAHDQRSAEH